MPETDRPEVLARWLRQLVGYFVMAVAGIGFAWIWELDLAFLRFLASQEFWSVGETAVTLGDLTERPSSSCWVPGLAVHEPALRRDALSPHADDPACDSRS